MFASRSEEKECPLLSLKLLEMYLASIDPRVPSKKTVRFKRADIVRQLSNERMRTDVFINAVDGLLDMCVKIKDETNPKSKGLKINLFSAGAWDLSGNKCEITVTCTNEAMNMFFGLENIQYYKYKLSEVINLSSKKSYLLLNYIIRNYYREEWTVSVNEIRTILEVDDGCYPETWRFVQLCLMPAVDEINSKTEFAISVKPLKENRSIVSFRVAITKIPKYLMMLQGRSAPEAEDDEGPFEIFNKEGAAWRRSYGFKEYIDERFNALYDMGTKEEMAIDVVEAIFHDQYDWTRLMMFLDLVFNVPVSKLPPAPEEKEEFSKYNVSSAEVTFYRRRNILESTYNSCLKKMGTTKITDEYAYFLQALKNKTDELIQSATEG